MKRSIAWLLAGLVAGLGLSGAAAAATYDVAANCAVVGLHYVFNGSARAPQAANGDPAGFICSGTAYAPIRFVAHTLGQQVAWDGASQTVSLTGTGAAGSSETQVAVFQPHDFNGVQTLTGSCWTDSIAAPRAGAYRCMTGNFILDPCFTGVGSGEVACPDPTANPDKQQGTIIRLTKPLPANSTAKPDPARPWRLRLADGSMCGAMTGTILPGHPYDCGPAPQQGTSSAAAAGAASAAGAGSAATGNGSSAAAGASSSATGGSSGGLYCTAPAPEAASPHDYLVLCAPLADTPAANGAPQLASPMAYRVAQEWL